MSRAVAMIGARSTPTPILTMITQLAEWLAQNGYYIRTGAAEGADWAAGIGAKDKTIWYLPWENYQRDKLNDAFNRKYTVGCAKPTKDAIALAGEYHPAWSACTGGAKLLHGRNMHIITGINLDKPVEFVICWTPNGAMVGGTSQALRYAMDLNIPIINLFDYCKNPVEDHFNKVKQAVEIYLK